MKNRFFTVVLLLGLLLGLTGNAWANAPSVQSTPSLVYVQLGSQDDLARFASTGLPMYASLEKGLLSAADKAGEQALQDARLTYQVLDRELVPGSYYLAQGMPGHEVPDFARFGTVLLTTTSNGALLRMDSSQAAALAKAGAELQAVTLTPKPLPAAQGESIFPEVVDPDPIIQTIIDQVTMDQIYEYDRGLAGEIPVWVDDGWTTITSRNTNSGQQIQKATHYVGQHMANDLGLDVEYHVWDNDTNPNVIGQISGLVNPDQIFIIGGHLDDVQYTPGGADDNASGSVAALVAADILSQFQWSCTLRFALWTGEEEGLLGSEAYAQRAYNQGENIVGYLNLDMIAWNTIGSDQTIYLGYDSGNPPSQDLALLFSDVVDAYNINLIPTIGTGYAHSSDHGSFNDYGYPAVLGIEGDDDFNPYYHGAGDVSAHTDPAYFTDFVKASLATFAHMSNCLIPSGVGHLDGHVTAAAGGAPIESATVTAENSTGHSYSTMTDASGYYTRTLMADTYTVTASAYSYLPATISGVVITTDTVTTQDFSLVTAPTYVVSGTVTESGTGLPLLAEIKFLDSPVTVWTDPSTGFYQAELPEDSYTMEVRAANHQPDERSIILDHNQTQDFVLNPLPCILLVDDDQDSPDVRSYYTDALDGLGLEYNVWDVSTAGNPGSDDIAGYRKLLWFLGYPYSGTFTGDNEAAVSSYLDAGGNFFLSGQDYLYDVGLTPFGQNYLHILNYTNDVAQTTVTGQNIFSGLGPYSLAYPFTNYSDVVNPDGQAQVAFSGNMGNAAVSFAGETFKTVFLGYPFEAISQPDNREAVMERMLDFFGACNPSSGLLEGHVTDAGTGLPLEGVLVTAAPGEAAIDAITDPSGYYSMTLPAGEYLVTASLDGYVSQSAPATILADQATTLDFALASSCEPVSGLDFTWLPAEPYTGDVLTFTATVSGSEPIDFSWDFGDTYTGTGSTVEYTYTNAGTYTVDLTATNACGTQTVSQELTILQYIWQIFLALVNRG